MMSRMRHDLLQPAAAMKILLRSLKGDMAPEKREKIIGALTDSVDELNHVVETIIDHQMMANDLIEAAPQACNLSAWLSTLLDTHRNKFAEAGIDLQSDVIATHVETDPILLDVIVSNLLSNAFEFTQNGFVRVSMRITSNGAMIEIADSGIGISADDLPKISKPYFVKNAEHARTLVRLGLGLARSEEAAKLLGARLEIDSAGQNRGTCARIILPN